MAQQNKVAVNLAQDFTDEQKLQGRQNIGASQISYNSTVTDMTVSKEIVRPYMNTKYSATIGSDNFLLLPSTFADGMVVKSNGSLQTQSVPQGLPTGGTAGQALILDANGDPIWSDVHDIGIREVPQGGTVDQVLTWNGTTYEWQDPFKYQAGYNVSTRSSGNVKSPYLDVNMLMKSSYSSGFGSAADTSADKINEINLADGQLTLEVHHYQRTATNNVDRVSFRIKINQGHSLNIFGRYTEVGANLPDNMSIWSAAATSGTYAELYAPAIGANVFFPERAPSNDMPHMIELHLTWVNSKHFRTFADITITRAGFLNGLANSEDITCVYQTMTSSTGDV